MFAESSCRFRGPPLRQPSNQYGKVDSPSTSRPQERHHQIVDASSAPALNSQSKKIGPCEDEDEDDDELFDFPTPPPPRLSESMVGGLWSHRIPQQAANRIKKQVLDHLDLQDGTLATQASKEIAQDDECLYCLDFDRPVTPPAVPASNTNAQDGYDMSAFDFDR